MRDTDAPTPTPTPARPRRRRRLLLWIGAPVLVVLLAGGFATWYLVFRDDAPPAVDIDTATESVTESTTGAGTGTDPTDLTGTWAVDPTVGTFTDFTSSFAGYRVQEELVGIGAKTAVGRTPDVTGTLEFDGTTLGAADLTVDTTTLQSDEDRRDNAIRGQALETDSFPTATFVLTEPIDVGTIPADGETVAIEATGELTLHGVTKPITFPLEAALRDAVIVVTGSLDVQFADYDIDRPTSGAVLSVEDHGVIELQLFFARDTAP
jgi:polyisoprenoid-binding protein YceI